MTTELIIALAGACAIIGAGASWFWRKRNVSKARDAATEAVAMKRTLDASRYRFIEQSDVTAEDLANMQKELDDKKEQLQKMRANKYRSEDDINELLKELER